VERLRRYRCARQDRRRIAQRSRIRRKDPKVFKGGALTYYGRWDYKIEEAARQGAAGVLLVHDAEAAGYGWSVVQNTWMGAQLSLATADPVAGRALIEGWIQKDAARALFSAAGLDLAAETGRRGACRLQGEVDGVQADATLHLSERQFTSSNVIALLPGASRRREYVLYTAHWDHLGRDPARAPQCVQRRGRGRLRSGRPFGLGTVLPSHQAGRRSVGRVSGVYRRGKRLVGFRILRRAPGFSLADTAAALIWMACATAARRAT